MKTPRRHVATCRSTNDVAMALAMAGEGGPLWLTADEQTGARGRAGRGWTGHADNLQASYLSTTASAPAALGQVALVAGLALHDAVTQSSGRASLPGLRLKWPNDLMIGPAKCAGILVETTDTASKEAGDLPARHAVVIGFGVNVAVAPDGLDRPATFLAAHGAALDREALLAALDCALAARLTQWDDGRGFPDIRTGWLAASGPLGQPIEVNAAGRVVRGGYAGVDAGGRLLVARLDGVTETLAFGDVHLPAG